MKRSTPPLLRDQAFRYHQDGDLAAAEHLYQLLLQTGGKDSELLYMFGVLRYQQGRQLEALGYLKRSSFLMPKNPAVWAVRGLAEANLGRLSEALTAYDRALALKPDHWEVYTNRALVLTGLGRHEEALASCDRALALRPSLAEAHNNRGNALRDLRQLSESRAAYDTAIAFNPGLAPAHNNRGKLATELGYPIQGLADYARALTLDPGYVEARQNIRVALAAVDDPLTVLVSLSGLPPREAFELYVETAERLEQRGCVDEALAAFDQALALKPTDYHTLNRKAIVLAEFGRLAEAAEVLTLAIALAPSEPVLYYNYGIYHGFEAGHRYIDTMACLERKIHLLSKEQKIYLNFALGKAASDCGDLSRSVSYLITGNSLKRSHFSYDTTSTDQLLKSVKANFTREIVSVGSGSEEASCLPVFIVGMPRSGSTLVHHLMAGHSRVFGAGETDAFETVLDSYIARTSKLFPYITKDLSEMDLHDIALAYLRHASPPSTKIKVILDKTLYNFWYIGLIHSAMPQARFIHIARDPSDTCFSIFSQLFRKPMLFAYDIRELAHYYRAYTAMMEHWQDILPRNTMLKINYEDLVAHPEQQARRLIAHCNLEWEPACLDTHLNSQPVRTASVAQIRRPIYNTSIGRSHQHEMFLQPFLDALQDRAPS